MSSVDILYPESNLVLAVQPKKDYSKLLVELKLEYSHSVDYLVIGNIYEINGWILYLSCIKQQYENLLVTVLPILSERQIPFKIPRDQERLELILDGKLGYTELGKVICIYPASSDEALNLAKDLITITAEKFKGPSIPTTMNLGSIVYTRFGAFNPILFSESGGTVKKFMKLNENQWIPDTENHPFKMPTGIPWPFTEIMVPEIPSKRKLLNNTYLPLHVLKLDVKGNVLRALYFKSFLKIKNCIIKQGKKNMVTDEYGRDIKSRLEWQYELYKQLHEDLPLPEIFDCFNEKDDTFLAMEFIKGTTLERFVPSLYDYNHWSDLKPNKQIIIIDILLDIIYTITRMHKRGYIHRDLTPANFLIDKVKKLYLIDLELAWSEVSLQPNPPFELGTFGYMSPNQLNKQLPTQKDDIYSIGALMIALLINLPPTKFYLKNSLDIIQNLNYLIENEEVAVIIAKCLSLEPIDRPDLNTIERALNKFKNTILDQPQISNSNHESKKLVHQKLDSVISHALNGLSLSNLTTEHFLWMSKSFEGSIRNRTKELTIKLEFNSGISGVIYFLSTIKSAGVDISNCLPTCDSNISYLINNYLSDQNITNDGLSTGTTGISLAMISAINSGLLYPTAQNVKFITSSFSNKSQKLNLANGISGQGLVLLNCLDSANIHSFYKNELRQTLSQYIDRILSEQQLNGSWNLLDETNNKKGIYTGLDLGQAGVILFLLAYLKFDNNNKIRHAVQRALSWISNQANKSRGSYYWYTLSKSKRVDLLGLKRGMPGIAFMYIKAYEIFKNDKYKEMADLILNQFPNHPIDADFTLESGLTGLGEVYLHAYEILGKREYLHRAEWILKLFLHTFHQKKEDAGYWMTDPDHIPTADLFTGYSGIVHFLIRYTMPGKLNHPISFI